MTDDMAVKFLYPNASESVSGISIGRASAASLFLFGSSFLIGLFWLAHGQPFEDAFILFTYARNFAAGHGFVYYPGGPHSEGFVDFLWVLILGAMTRMGMDAAFSSIILSAIAAGFGGFLFWRCMCVEPKKHTPAILLLWVFPVWILFSNAAVAGYGGFSSIAFSVLALYILSQFEAPRISVFFVPACLTLALLRADGVILAAAFYFTYLPQVVKTSAVRPYLVAGGCCAALGAAYFFWRWNYFHLLLPLPLYVKSQSKGWPGWVTNRNWLTSLPYSPLIFLAIYIAANAGRHKRAIEYFKLAFPLIPYAALGVALCFARQLQNVAYRFQSPINFAAAYLAFRAVSGRLLMPAAKSRVVLFSVLLFAAAVPSVYEAFQILGRATRPWPDYLSTFAIGLKKTLEPGDVLAVTEAGRIAYWTGAHVEDLHGLNTPYIAVHLPDTAYFSKMRPSVFLLDHGGILDVQAMNEAGDGPIAPISRETIRKALIEPYSRFLVRNAGTHEMSSAPDVLRYELETFLALRYLLESGEYEIYGVRFYMRSRGQSSFWHLFAFNKKSPHAELWIQQLYSSFEHAKVSYFDLKSLAASSA